jgi:hypothetical protein
MGELGKKRQRVQANLRRIVEKFREQTNAAIQAATAMALQGMAEQVVELQVLRADKANRDLRGPGFWKLDQENCNTQRGKHDCSRSSAYDGGCHQLAP